MNRSFAKRKLGLIFTLALLGVGSGGGGGVGMEWELTPEHFIPLWEHWRKRLPLQFKVWTQNRKRGKWEILTLRGY